MKQKPWPIYHHIDKNFREFSLYSLEQRGIPNWYDSLTNVQRIALTNSPNSYSKTISLVGECISAGYHHGNISLEGSINRITKNFGNSESMLIGDGFFGTPVKPDAAAARYTSVKINPKIQQYIKEYSHLNEKGGETFPYLNLRAPLGLTNHIIGIAIGWKASILPRKLEEIDKYLSGKKANLNPYFQNFDGDVQLYPETTKTWIISGKVNFDDKLYSATIVDLPPMIRYGKFLEKLAQFIEESGWNVTIQNNSSEKVNIFLQLKNNRDNWPEFRHKINNLTKVMISENLVFIKDRQVVEYQSITDYLQDFKKHVENVKMLQLDYEAQVADANKNFHYSKKQYLEYMLEKKRTDKEVDWFLEQYTKVISNKLRDIRLTELTQQALERTEAKINEYNNEIQELVVKKIEQSKVVESMKNTIMIGAVTKNQITKDEVMDTDIDLWEGDDEYEFKNMEEE